MKTVELTLLFLMAVGSFIISFLQFSEKGPLLNNAALFATEEERKKMDKKPHYRQSGIVFALLGAIFLLIALEMLLKTGWLYYVALAAAAVAVVYAVASSIKQMYK